MLKEQYLHVEGIVLHTLPFKEYDRILTLFTPTEGVIKLFVKVNKRTALQLSALTAPFTVAEYLYLQGNGSLGRFREGCLINQNLKLRDSFSFIESAEQLSKALLISQWPGKAAPQLYFLFRIFLEKIPLARYPQTLISSFFLKLLKHEGNLQTSPHCSTCQSPLKESFRFKGECYCPKDSFPEALFFSDLEEASLAFLANCRSVLELSSCFIEDSLSKKIALLFKQSNMVD